MKEKFIQEITDSMSGTLTVDQMAQLNSVLLQTISKYTVIEDGDKVKEDFASNNRLLEIFLSAKLVEGCSAKTIKYYETTVKQLFKYTFAIKSSKTDFSGISKPFGDNTEDRFPCLASFSFFSSEILKYPPIAPLWSLSSLTSGA